MLTLHLPVVKCELEEDSGDLVGGISGNDVGLVVKKLENRVEEEAVDLLGKLEVVIDVFLVFGKRSGPDFAGSNGFDVEVGGVIGGVLYKRDHKKWPEDIESCFSRAVFGENADVAGLCVIDIVEFVSWFVDKGTFGIFNGGEFGEEFF